jgi:hypothetical protein
MIFRGGWPSEAELGILSGACGRLSVCLKDGLGGSLLGNLGGPMGVLVIAIRTGGGFGLSKGTGGGGGLGCFLTSILVLTFSVFLNFRSPLKKVSKEE